MSAPQDSEALTSINHHHFHEMIVSALIFIYFILMHFLFFRSFFRVEVLRPPVIAHETSALSVMPVMAVRRRRANADDFLDASRAAWVLRVVRRADPIRRWGHSRPISGRGRKKRATTTPVSLRPLSDENRGSGWSLPSVATPISFYEPAWSRSGLHDVFQSHGRGEIKMAVDLLLLLVTFMVVYLFYAVIHPEKF
jgi:K+-transporting ATPase KdpF subunit